MICAITEQQGYTEHFNDPATLKQILATELLHLYSMGYTEICVNCEYGVPLWTAEAVCMLKQHLDIRLHLVVPFEEQCREWGEAARNRYYAVHEKADSITFAGTHLTPNCYQAADRLMADKSDLILVFGDGQEPPCLAQYAKENGVTLRYIQ